MKPGPKPGFIMSEEHKRKISITKSGVPVSDAHKEKLRIAATGQIFTEERKRNISNSRVGADNPMWKGGRIIKRGGYIYINIGKNKMIMEHRFVVEKIFGRKLKKTEIIHHINGITNDNRECNLYYFRLNCAHLRFHRYCKKIGINFRKLLESNLKICTFSN